MPDCNSVGLGSSPSRSTKEADQNKNSNRGGENQNGWLWLTGISRERIYLDNLGLVVPTRCYVGVRGKDASGKSR
jgi:hypothetical protein